MIDEVKIVNQIYTKLYIRDVDYSINIFLCGAATNRKDSLRHLLNLELKKDAKFHSVYPETIFSSLYGKGGYNLLELEDELANYVDIILLPLEGVGTYCELGAFSVNKKLLPKIVAINSNEFSKVKSFINQGPLELIKKLNSSNLIIYNKGKEDQVIPKILDRLRGMRKHSWDSTYDLMNLFNLSRFVLFLIAIFQPLDIQKMKSLIGLLSTEKVKTKYLDSAIQILTQKNRIEQDFDHQSSTNKFTLSVEGHNYVFEELIASLNVKNDFTAIRSEIINYFYAPKKKLMSKDKELLV